jgi:hypothetical protein
MIKGLDYWYDGQMRRFMQQIVRAFSGFCYQTGRRVAADGTPIPPQLIMVPCRHASVDRMVGQIMRNGSENTVLAPPMITVHMTGLQGRNNDIQNLSHVDTRQVQERAIDPETNTYTSARGRSYTVERMMPRPFEMTVQVDIWTSNEDQKQQLSEQILTIFYPNILIQNSDNALDWGALTTLNMDDVNWTSRSIPVGGESEIDILTMTFKIPFWLSPPAKVQRQRIIQQIVTNIYDARDGEELTDQNYLTRTITTPGNHGVYVDGNKIVLLGAKENHLDEDGKPFEWDKLIDLYGIIRPTQSRLHIRTNPDLDDDTHDITGTIQYDQNAVNELYWQVDLASLPANTVAPIDAVIDPRKNFPGEKLPSQANGQRYLIVTSLTGPSQAWGNLNAEAGDVIAFENGAWSVSLDPREGPAPQYVLNKRTGQQLRWTGSEWVRSFGGVYPPGMWRLHL